MTRQIIIMALLLGVGVYVTYRRHLSSDTVGELMSLLLHLFIPALVFHSIISQLDRAVLFSVWYLPFLAGAGVLLSIGCGELASSILGLQGEKRQTFLYLLGFNNYIFFAIPLVSALFGEKGLALLFVHNVGCSTLKWSLGLLILKPKHREKAWLSIVNPIFISVLVALFCVIMGWHLALRKSFFMDMTKLLGQAVTPLVMLVVAALMVVERPHTQTPPKRVMGVLSALRLCVVPVLLWAVLSICHVPVLSRDMLVLVALMPSGMLLAIMSKKYQVDHSFAIWGISITTLLSMLTIPLMSIWLLSGT